MSSPLIHITKVSMNSIMPRLVEALEVSETDIHIHLSSGLCIVLTNLNMWWAWLAKCEMNSRCLGRMDFMVNSSPHHMKQKMKQSLKLQLIVPLRDDILRDLVYTCGLGRMSSCIWVDCVDLCESYVKLDGAREDLYVYLGLLVVRGDNIVCFNANML